MSEQTSTGRSLDRLRKSLRIAVATIGLLAIMAALLSMRFGLNFGTQKLKLSLGNGVLTAYWISKPWPTPPGATPNRFYFQATECNWDLVLRNTSYPVALRWLLSEQFKFVSGGAMTYWHLPLWIPFFLCAYGYVLLAWPWGRSDSCRRCNYNLTGVISSVCPECGTQFRTQEPNDVGLPKNQTSDVGSTISPCYSSPWQDATLRSMRRQLLAVTLLLFATVTPIFWAWRTSNKDATASKVIDQVQQRIIAYYCERRELPNSMQDLIANEARYGPYTARPKFEFERATVGYFGNSFTFERGSAIPMADRIRLNPPTSMEGWSFAQGVLQDSSGRAVTHDLILIDGLSWPKDGVAVQLSSMVLREWFAMSQGTIPGQRYVRIEFPRGPEDKFPSSVSLTVSSDFRFSPNDDPARERVWGVAMPATPADVPAFDDIPFLFGESIP